MLGSPFLSPRVGDSRARSLIGRFEMGEGTGSGPEAGGSRLEEGGSGSEAGGSGSKVGGLQSDGGSGVLTTVGSSASNSLIIQAIVREFDVHSFDVHCAVNNCPQCRNAFR